VIPGARPDPVCWPGADVARAAAQVNHLYGQASGQTRQLEDMLASLQRVSQQMDSQWRMQVVRTSTSKSDVWKRRVEQVAEETDALKAALDKHTHRERRCARGPPHAPASAPAAQSRGSSAHCAACSQRHCARCSHKQTPPPESCRLPGPALCRVGGSVGDRGAEEQQRERQRQRRGPAEALPLPPACARTTGYGRPCARGGVGARRRQVEDQERQELLARRAGQGDAAAWRGDADADAQAASFVDSSRRALEEAFETGTAALASMAGQRERLKARPRPPHAPRRSGEKQRSPAPARVLSCARACAAGRRPACPGSLCACAQSAQRKALDVLNSIGLSDSVLRLIDRRQQWDKRLAYGGMVVTLLVLALLWWWLRARRH